MVALSEGSIEGGCSRVLCGLAVELLCQKKCSRG